MPLDHVRSKLMEAVRARRSDLANVSRAIGKNHAYLHQFVNKGKPRRLPDNVRRDIADFLGMDEMDLVSPEDRARLAKRKSPIREEKLPDDIVMIRELDVRASAGANGSLIEVNQENESEHIVGLYGFPLAGFRENYGAAPEEVRILQVIGDSMQPTLWPGQRVMVNHADRMPSPPGIFVLWDGIGLVVKRLEFIPHSDPQAVRIISDNARYSAYERAIGEAHICGRVIGAWGRL